MKNTLIYNNYAGSETIRQMPQNYLIAFKQHGAWKIEPDLACDKKLATKLFLLLLDYAGKYGTGEYLISKLK